MAGSLVVKLGAIGDCLMVLPGARALFEGGQGEAIDWVCGDGVAPVLALYPWIRPIVVNERRFLHGSAGERMEATAGVWGELARRRYDLVATLYYDARYGLLTLPARAGRRVRLSHTDRRYRLLPGRHHADEFARVLMGWPDDVRPAGLAPVAPVVMPASPLARVEGRRRTILVPGGARNLLRDDALRRWPIESYAEVARELLARGHEVVISGGPEDGWVLPQFAGLGVTEAVGRWSLVETLGLYAEADLVMTHDTGPMHLAGLTRTPLLAIFGPTDPHGRLPRRAGAMAIWGGERFACRPCYDGQGYAACHHNACVEEVSPEMAVEAAELLLRRPEMEPRVMEPSVVRAVARGLA